MIALATITPEQFQKYMSDLSDHGIKLDICNSVLETMNGITQYTADPYSDDESKRLHAYTLCKKQVDLNNFCILLSDIVCKIRDSVLEISDTLGLASIDIPDLDPYNGATPGKKKILTFDINIDSLKHHGTEDTPQAPTLSTNPPTVSDYPWMDLYPTASDVAECYPTASDVAE